MALEITENGSNLTVWLEISRWLGFLQSRPGIYLPVRRLDLKDPVAPEMISSPNSPRAQTGG
jgi:hypothetical protein